MADSFVKDPDSVQVFSVIWCDKTNLNTGAATDDGDLQGETINTAAAQMPAGITLDAENSDSVVIQGITYAVNTAHKITLSGGTA